MFLITNQIYKSFSLRLLFSLAIMAILLVACDTQTKSVGPVYQEISNTKEVPCYSFAIHALYNPAKMLEVYMPLINDLNSKLEGAQIKLESSRDYNSFENKYNNRKPELLLPNPWQTIQAIEQGYNVIATEDIGNDFKGIFIVRKDGNIKTIKDLIGKKISYPSNTAVAACILPQIFLHKKGIDVNNDIENLYVGSQESSIKNVYLKNSSAAASYPIAWYTFKQDFPREASELYVIWETETTIGNSIMIRDDIPENIKSQIKKYFVELENYDEGQEILKNTKTKRYIDTENKDYLHLSKLITDFEKEIRKVERR